MLKHLFQASMGSFIIYVIAMAALPGIVLAQQAQAEEPLQLVLVSDTPAERYHVGYDQQRDYSYRRVNHDKVIAVMLYGFQPQPGFIQSIIPKDKKALSGFFKQHFDNIKRDYLPQIDQSTMRFVAGDEAFTSRQINRGIESEPARMAGVTVPMGNVTLGGGYVWGEKNPAMMMPVTDGLFVGASYETGDTGFQISYLTAGQDVAGFEAGGTDIQYSSVLVGTTFRVSKRMSLTATAQYRNDKDPLTTGDRAAVFTIGTRWKF